MHVVFRGIILATLQIYMCVHVLLPRRSVYSHNCPARAKLCFVSRKEYYCLLYLVLHIHTCANYIYFSETACPTVLLAQSLKVIHGFLKLWPSVLSHVNFDLGKLLPGQQEMTLPPIVQQLTLQTLLQALPGSLKWYQQVRVTQKNFSLQYKQF